MTGRCRGLKIVGDNHYVYGRDRKYGDETYRKCEIKCKATLPAILGNDNISVRKSFSDLKAQS